MKLSIVNPNPPEPQPLTVAAMARFWRALSEAAQHAPQPIKWVVYMRPEVYSHLIPRSQQKMQPYVRKAWRDANKP